MVQESVKTQLAQHFQQFLRLPWTCDWQMKSLISQEKALKMKGFSHGHELDLRTWPTGSVPRTTPQRSPCPRCQRHYEDGPSHRHSKEPFQRGGRRNLIHSAWIGWNSRNFWILSSLTWPIVRNLLGRHYALLA